MIFVPQRTALATAVLAALLSLGGCGGSEEEVLLPGTAGMETPTSPLGVVGATGDEDADGASGGPSGGNASVGGSMTGNPSTTDGGSTPVPGGDGSVTGGTGTDELDDGAGIVESDAALPDDVARRLERALSLYRGDPIELAATIVERFDAADGGTVETRRTSAEPAFANATGAAVDFRCANGGTAGSRDTVDDAGTLRERNVTFSDCRVGAFDVTGTARRTVGDVPAGIALPAPFTAAELAPSYPNLGLRIVDSRDGSEVVLNRSAQAFTSFPDPSSTDNPMDRNRAAGGEPVRLVDVARRTTLARIAVGSGYRDDGTGQIGIVEQSGDVQLSGNGADGLRSVTMPGAFERDVSDPRYTAGTLEIAGDGFRYVLDAGNGDPGSFQLSVEVDGTTTAYTVPWSERFDVDAFGAARVDLGLGG